MFTIGTLRRVRRIIISCSLIRMTSTVTSISWIGKFSTHVSSLEGRHTLMGLWNFWCCDILKTGGRAFWKKTICFFGETYQYNGEVSRQNLRCNDVCELTVSNLIQIVNFPLSQIMLHMYKPHFQHFVLSSISYSKGTLDSNESIKKTGWWNLFQRSSNPIWYS